MTCAPSTNHEIDQYTGEKNPQHVPVMIGEVMEYLSPTKGGLYVDGTFGLGGYSRAILNCPGTRVVGIDQDPAAQPHADRLCQKYPDRFTFVAGNFDSMDQHLETLGIKAINGFVLDLGVSSPQLDRAERGFSFLHDGPLDMRMGQSEKTAGDIVNQLSRQDLAHIFRTYGEERKASKIAAAIEERRSYKNFTRTLDLASVVQGQFSDREKRQMSIHPATRVFQALRIAVNDELGALERGLTAGLSCLAPGGTMVVVSFHSLEDRLVKNVISRMAGKEQTFVPKDLQTRSSIVAPLTKKPVTPSKREVEINPRSRSAKLRAARRLDAPFTPSPPTSGRDL